MTPSVCGQEGQRSRSILPFVTVMALLVYTYAFRPLTHSLTPAHAHTREMDQHAK